jgi:hypothetical protein
MFGIIGKAIVVALLGISAIVSLYEAGRFESGYVKRDSGKDARNVQIVSFIMDIVLIALLIF